MGCASVALDVRANPVATVSHDHDARYLGRAEAARAVGRRSSSSLRSKLRTPDQAARLGREATEGIVQAIAAP
jgi:hypothetical protein